MRILGIDPSLKRCGYAVLDGDVLLAHATICAEREFYHERVSHIIGVLETVIVQYHVTHIACERPFRSPERTAALQVAVQAIKSWCRHDKYPLALYSPGEWKASVVGNGMATKDQVRECIRLYFPGTDGQEHEFDAIGIAMHCQNMLRLEAMRQEKDRA